MIKRIFIFFYHVLWITEQFFGYKKIGWSSLRQSFYLKYIYPYQKGENVFKEVPQDFKTFLSASDLLNLPSNSPLLFKGLANQTNCVKNWNWDYLKNQIGDLDQPFTDTFSKNSFNSGVGNTKELINNILSENPQYSIMFGDATIKNKNLNNDLELSKWIDLSKFKFKLNKSWKFFAAGKGRNTNLHCELGNGLIIQVVGEKRWIIFPPEFSMNVNPKINWKMYIESATYPNFSLAENNNLGIEAYEVVLKPGDVLYCPAYFWHFVTNQTAAVSISYKWTNASSFIKNPFLSACVLSSRYPSSIFRLPILKKFSIIHPPVG